MTTALRTAITLIGLLATAFLTVGFLDELRDVMRGTADSALALLIPFLVFAAVLTALTSPATALVLNVIGMVLMFLAVIEGEGTAMGYIGVALVVVMSAMLLMLIRPRADA